MQAIVNKIIPFSSVDGPGNRTSIFLQACNIDCKYCHNPETRKICRHCGICVEHCPTKALSMNAQGKVVFSNIYCIECDQCIQICPYDSSPKVLYMTVEEVYKQIQKQIPFIRGITVSGGECMLWPEFLTKLFQKVKGDGLSTLIDSNGTILFEKFPKLLEYTDGVMLDIKAFDNQDHIRVTGYGNENVLANALYLGEHKKLEEIRCVIVPDLYDAINSINEMALFLKPLLRFQDIRIKLIAYRPMGVREEYSHYRTPSKEELMKLESILREHNFTNIIII